ncbi:extracellular solute-binding protein [Ruegeria sp. HKCCD7255]|uniref:extracellular solute-binding protein n=1 Tax=Ruegeria sp. HKCCD7255 TaxID=2683004 RepID=UPI001487F475|nr:extracellular solute-binding protein [Ruegeria sp. HKCCD7255]
MKKVMLPTAICLAVSTGSVQAENDITVWAWGSAAPALQATVDGFNAQHSDIKVTIEQNGYSDVKSRVLAACAAGGAGLPDIFQFQNVEMELITAQFPDCAADLVPLGFDQSAQSAFPDFKLFAQKQGDRVLGMPWDSGPVMMFYRRDFYENAGVSLEDIETWDDFIEAGKKVQAANDGVTMINDNLNGGAEFFRMIAEEQGCGYFSADGNQITMAQPGCVAALEVIGKLNEAGLVTAANFNEKLQNNAAGVVATQMSGAWMEGPIRNNAPEDQAGKWGIYEMPSVVDGGARAANFGGSLLAVAGNSDQKEAAYAFLSYALGSVEGQVTMLKDQGLVPSLTTALNDPFVSEPSAFWGDQAIWTTVLGRLERIQPINGTEFFSDADQVMIATQTAFLNGEFESAQAALDDAAKQVSFATGLAVAE